MEIPAALAADLTTLTQALDDPDPNLNPLLSALARDTALVVDSYLGMSLSIDAGVDTNFGLTMMADNPPQVEVRTSLQLPLARISDSVALGALTFYAAKPGAFVDPPPTLAGRCTWIRGCSCSIPTSSCLPPGPKPVWRRYRVSIRPSVSSSRPEPTPATRPASSIDAAIAPEPPGRRPPQRC